jgi:hypothetical protein
MFKPAAKLTTHIKIPNQHWIESSEFRVSRRCRGIAAILNSHARRPHSWHRAGQRLSSPSPRNADVASNWVDPPVVARKRTLYQLLP